jgi:hypothetical protein
MVTGRRRRRIGNVLHNKGGIMNELVQRLSEGGHPVVLALRPEKSIETLKRQLDRGYVHIKFTNTRGGTELGVRIDRNSCVLPETAISSQTGTIKLVGDLVLNYEKVRCIADIDLATLSGTGHLEPVQ